MPTTPVGEPKRPPLREFVYLDGVSLRSLLSSQKGALTENITELLSRADEAELAGSLSGGAPVFKAEITSRYQTSNSQGTQTSRKSIVQSLFKEFRELEGVRLLLQPIDVLEPPASIEELIRPESAMAVSSEDLERGGLVEVEVELVADPIFRFSTIISEISDMAREYPDMLAAPGAASVMAEAEPVNRVLQRLLAGLIPLRARAINVVMVEIRGVEYLVPAVAAAALGIRTTPLFVVGVTEHLSYWRDVRRVLFSGAKFTMLCRIARDGLHRGWVPVKLSQVLAEIAPTFPGALDEVGRFGYNQVVDTTATEAESALQKALETFVQLAASRAGTELPPDAAARVRDRRISCVGMAGSVTAQNEAFRSIRSVLSNEAEVKLAAEDWLEVQREARDRAELPLFRLPTPEPTSRPPVREEGPGGESEPAEVLLDTEVIAIYW